LQKKVLNDHIKKTKDVVARRIFESPNAFGGRAPPGPARGTSALPHTPDPQPQSGTGPISTRREGSGRKGKREKGGGEGRGWPPVYLTSGYGPAVASTRSPPMTGRSERRPNDPMVILFMVV